MPSSPVRPVPMARRRATRSRAHPILGPVFAGVARSGLAPGPGCGRAGEAHLGTARPSWAVLSRCRDTWPVLGSPPKVVRTLHLAPGRRALSGVDSDLARSPLQMALAGLRRQQSAGARSNGTKLPSTARCWTSSPGLPGACGRAADGPARRASRSRGGWGSPP